jgi:hypothetical protein
MTLYNPSGERPSEVNPSPASSEEDDEEPLNPTPLSVIRPAHTPVSESLTSEMERVVAGMSRISVPDEP